MFRASALALLVRNAIVPPRDVRVDVKPSHKADVVAVYRTNLLFCDRVEAWVDTPFGCTPYTFYSVRRVRVIPSVRGKGWDWSEHGRTMAAIYNEGRSVTAPKESPVVLRSGAAWRLIVG